MARPSSALLETYRSGRLHHAWLISGPAGIGKATLAYRMARFVLAHPDPRAATVQAAKSLAVAADHAVTRRMAAQTHGDLLVIERTVNEKTGKLRQDIQVDDVRAWSAFSARRRARGDGASPSSMRSTSSTTRALTLCSRCWRSHRGARCCCW